MANILIFDSGVGGLSVYQEVSQRLAQHQYFYLFDNACFPYGELNEDYLVNRVLQLFAAFTKLHHIDIAIIACNSASTYVLPALREQLAIPVVGVVPAIKPAAEYSRAQQPIGQQGHLGVLATPGTVSRNYTAELIASFAADLKVSLLGTTELVQMAEDKLAGIPVDTARLARILAPWQDIGGPDTLVLGCTHFPLLAAEISECLPNTHLVDSGAAIARRVVSLLDNAEEELIESQTRQAFYTLQTKKAQLQAGAFNELGFSSLQCLKIDK